MFVLFLDFLYTVLLYGAAPLLYLLIRRTPTTRKSFLLFCIISTTFVWLSISLAYYLSGLEHVARPGPAFVWGTVFYQFILSRLSSSGRIYDPLQPPPAIPADPFDEENINPNPPVEEAPSNIPPADSSHGSISKRKPFFSKYQTFYTCPGCGQLNAKGTPTCDCGYVFIKMRNWKKARRIAAFSLFSILLLCLTAYGGYRMGVDSTTIVQYNTGYHDGYGNGRNDGIQLGMDMDMMDVPAAYEAGYCLAMQDSGNATGSVEERIKLMVSDFDGKDELISSLRKEYGIQ